MSIRLIVKKLGNNWYVDVEHTDPLDIQLNRKINRFLTYLDKENIGILELEFFETNSMLNNNCLWFKDSSLLKYFTTDDSIQMEFVYYDYDFSISSELYMILEEFYNFNFHKTVYNLEIHNRTL